MARNELGGSCPEPVATLAAGRNLPMDCEPEWQSSRLVRSSASGSCSTATTSGCAWRRQRRSSIAIGRPPIQADISLRRGIDDQHIAALLEVARRRALEPITLEDDDVEIVAMVPTAK